MIEASFDRLSRRAAIDGAYQYDTGQRLRLSGLPSPDELAEADDFLTGDMVTVQAHFGYVGDTQTESRLAQWDEDRYCWMAEIPDEYLTRNEQVNVYVYVYHGETDDGSRTQTMYEGVFTPAYRPAPNNVASDDMLEQWAELEEEVDLVLSTMDTALENAYAQAENADAAAQEAATAAQDATDAAREADNQIARLEAVEAFWDETTATVENLPASADAYVSTGEGAIVFGIPQGDDGDPGETGDTGPADISLTFADGVLTIAPN